MGKLILELWADSFHEGDWCCHELAKIYEKVGGTSTREYVNGFIPKYTFQRGETFLEIQVYGSYDSWYECPKKVKELIEWGKPDFIAYDPIEEKILFAVEETAAVPTGNQALQRCERIFGSAQAGIPFFYLLSEFGLHKDKHIRRASIWPTIMSLKLSNTMHVPCVVLFYSDKKHPEDYNYGNGVSTLFHMIYRLLNNKLKNKEIFDGMKEAYIEVYKEMISFVSSQWREQIQFLPGEEVEVERIGNLASKIADVSLTNQGRVEEEFPNFLKWPSTQGLPDEVQKIQQSRSLNKYDRLCELFEEDLDNKKAYSLSGNTGSRPQSSKSIEKWIAEQKELFDKSSTPANKPAFTMKVSDFPYSSSVDLALVEADDEVTIVEENTEEFGLGSEEELESEEGLMSEVDKEVQDEEQGPIKDYRHVTTAKNIVYLYDHWKDVKTAVAAAYPRLKARLEEDDADDDMPALVYVSNSLRKGRIFGDPFTGQLAAYSTIFSKDKLQPRKVLVYYPHQVHSQYVNGKSNKGKILLQSSTDYLLFNAGVLVRSSDKEVY